MISVACRTFLLGALVGLAGCSTGVRSPSGAQLQHLRIVAGPAANEGSATALDLVFVYGDGDTRMLPQDGPGWFSQKSALVAALELRVDIVSLQLAPTTVLDVPFPKHSGNAVAVYGYANYLAPGGQKRIDLTAFKDATLHLAPESIVIEPAIQ